MVNNPYTQRYGKPMPKVERPFGDGYPGKRWQDAAAEVAWNIKIIKRKIAFCIDYFLNPKTEMRTLFGLNEYKDFPAFRSAFMKWLSDNERREG